MAGRYWREAASLIIVGRSHAVKTPKNMKNDVLHHDYNILSLTRSLGSSFMPDAVVFPGGKLDKADMSPSWLSLFKERGYSENDLRKIFRFPTNKNIEMYTNKEQESLLPELAFRICALRETFEETGLLLVASNPQDSFSSVFPLEIEEINKWRKLIHEDSSQFLKLLEHTNCLPSAPDLHEWSDWLTPTFYGGLKNRFDTAFYITFIDSDIHVKNFDKFEVASAKISGPMNILNSYYNKKLILKPPQLYELSRLARYSKLIELKDFTEERSSKGMVRILPVKFTCQDGVALLFEGDEHFPKSPNYFEEENLQINKTVKELRESSRCLHRIESIKGKEDKLFAESIASEKDHIIPVSFDKLILNFQFNLV